MNQSIMTCGEKMYEKRLIGYRTMGYIIEEKSPSKAEQMRLF